MNNPAPMGANNTPVEVGDVVHAGDEGRQMLVVDLHADTSMVTVSWKDARGAVFETTLKGAMLTVLTRPKARS
jgi:hypothetical protein